MGVQVSRPFEWNHIGWIPEVSIGVSRQHYNPNGITAQFAAGGNSFKVQPQAGGSEYINPGAGLTAILANGWSVRLSYNAVLNQQTTSHQLDLSVSTGF